MSKYTLLSFILAICVLSSVSENLSEDENVKDGVARGEVQSCRGCSLNRLPGVKTFIYGDLPKYSGVEFHPIPGAVPHLVLFDKSDKELERIDLSPLSREDCNELVSKWFQLNEPVESDSKEDREEL